MKIIRNIASMQNRIKEIRKKGKTIGFVPTMGYLHSGHISLAHQSVKKCDITVMSIYVNPMQFGPREDYKKYPRDLKADVKLAKKAGVDYLFVPSDSDMYPQGFSSKVVVTNVTEMLCGVSRPGHFEGVTTVVLKLFNIIMPDAAYFGQKDAQQVIVIKKMAKDLNLPLEIKALPIVRENDGLAMSSRNSYLSKTQRLQALCLYQALSKARQLIRCKERNPAKIIAAMKRLLLRGKSVRIDYINIVDAEDLQVRKIIKGKVLIALAVFIGKVRLIDNIIVKVKNKKLKKQ
ncbi:MAG: pantoate--beta-alanine ligase [Candidatus Omnitrophota bacterium]